MSLQTTYEKQLIARIVSDKDLYYQNSDIISADLFEDYTDEHKVFEVFEEIIKKDGYPSLAKVSSKLSKAIANELINTIKSADHTIPIEQIVAELDEMRKSKIIDQSLTRAASEFDSEEKIKILTDAMTSIIRSERSKLNDGFEVAKKALKTLTEKTVIDIPTGFTYLDSITGGLNRSDLVIVAAETSQGKTSLMLNTSQNVIDAGRSVVFISLEMSETQLMLRMILSEAEVEKKDAHDCIEQLQQVASDYSHKKFYIADVTNNSIQHITGLIRGAAIRFNINVAFVDYLQLVGDKSKANREQEIGGIARGLKNLAKELDICIVAGSQLGRPRQGQSHYPTLARLRDSGQIEEAADVVLFIYRPETYGIDEYDGQDTRNLAEIILAKGRNYGTGKFKTNFYEGYTKFTNTRDAF